MSLGNFSINSYEIKISKTGLKVPVVNEVHLHSIYDPMREARGFIEQSYKGPEVKNYLVLGLGFGYHVAALLDKIHESKTEARIVVIEPNPKVTFDCIELDLINQDEVYLVINQTPEQIYSNRDLTKFLLLKPQIISHASSFNLYSDYFRNLLSHEASGTIKSIIDTIESPVLSEYLESFELDTYEQVINQLEGDSSFHNELDLLILALEKITKKSQQLTHG